VTKREGAGRQPLVLSLCEVLCSALVGHKERMKMEPHDIHSPHNACMHRAGCQQTQASHATLQAELERERMRLAACGVVALANTPESAAKARDMHADYRSASCDDVARMVDLQMQYRAALVNLRDGMAEAKNSNVVDYIDAVLGAA